MSKEGDTVCQNMGVCNVSVLQRLFLLVQDCTQERAHGASGIPSCVACNWTVNYTNFEGQRLSDYVNFSTKPIGMMNALILSDSSMGDRVCI